VIYPEVLNRLLQGDPLSLADWFAAPVGVEPARAAAANIQQQLLTRRNESQRLFQWRLAEIIARYWAGHDIEAGVKNFSAILRDRREQALLALCYGQLRLARKWAPAWEHLDRGFELAAHLLEPEDYFRVLKRHDLLRQLVLGAAPLAAAPLEVLLDEARIIARLKGARQRRHSVEY